MSTYVVEAEQQSHLTPLAEELNEWSERMHEARKKGRFLGAVTGLREIDYRLGGYLQPGIHVLQAAPGAGKTALALQIASDCGCPALYVTYEMPPLELFRRLCSRQTETYLQRLKSGELPRDEVAKRSRETLAKLPMLQILDATKGIVTPADINSAAKALQEYHNTDGVLIVVDSLQYLARRVAGDEAASEYEAINAAVAGLGELAAELNSPILAISHRSRSGQSNGGLHAAKGSGDIEYAAESILELSDSSGGYPNKGETERVLHIHKNRHGELGEMSLTFTGRLQTFKEAL